MLIGISGKIGSGKDTVGKIIQYLEYENNVTIKTNRLLPNPIGLYSLQDFLDGDVKPNIINTFEVKKFADKLKNIVCLLIGCTREQLEDHEFKNTELGEEWTYYSYADGHNDHYRNGEWTKSMHSVPCTKEKYEEEKRINWQTAYKRVLTPRLLLQLIGTECGRNIIHPNVWVNSLMGEYKSNLCNNGIFCTHTNEDGSTLSWIPTPLLEPTTYPNWIITDMRFPNELQAVKEREGISIRIERYPNTLIQSRGPGLEETIAFDSNNKMHLDLWKAECTRQHPSETALDTATFDYTINNNGTIEELIIKVKEILIKEKIINT